MAASLALAVPVIPVYFLILVKFPTGISLSGESHALVTFTATVPRTSTSSFFLFLLVYYPYMCA